MATSRSSSVVLYGMRCEHVGFGISVRYALEYSRSGEEFLAQ